MMGTGMERATELMKARIAVKRMMTQMEMVRVQMKTMGMETGMEKIQAPVMKTGILMEIWMGMETALVQSHAS